MLVKLVGPETLVSSYSVTWNCCWLLITSDWVVDTASPDPMPFILLPWVNSSPPRTFPEFVMRFWQLPWIKLSLWTPSCFLSWLEKSSLISWVIILCMFFSLNDFRNFRPVLFSGCDIKTLFVCLGDSVNLCMRAKNVCRLDMNVMVWCLIFLLEEYLCLLGLTF